MANLRVIRSVLLFTATNALAAAMPLLLLPILTRLLTPEDYGAVAMFSIVITAFGAVAGLSVHGAVGMRYFDREEFDFPRYIGNCLLILAATTAALAIVVLITHRQITAVSALPLEWLLVAVGVAAVQFILLIRLAIFQSSKNAGFFAAFRISQATIDAGLSLLFVVGLALAWQGRVAGMSIAIVLVGLAALVSLVARGWIDLTPDRAYIRNALQFGLPLVPHVVGGMLLASVDRVMITNLLGIGETGIYMVAVQIGLGIYLVADACNRAISPWHIEALKKDERAVDLRIVRFALLYFAGLLVLAILVGGLAPWVLPLIVGPNFVGASDYIWMIALGQAFGGMYFFVSNVIFYKSRTLILSAITISCGLLNAALSYILLHSVGLIGAATAYAVAQLAMFISAFVFSQRLRPLPWALALSGRIREA